MSSSYVNIVNYDWTVPAANLDAAYAAVVALNADNACKNQIVYPDTGTKPAGSTSNAPDDNHSLAGLDWDFDTKLFTLREVLEEMGLIIEITQHKSLTIVGMMEPEWWDTEQYCRVLNAIAPHSVDGSWIEVRDSDDFDDWFRIVVETDHIVAIRPIVSWANEISDDHHDDDSCFIDNFPG